MRTAYSSLTNVIYLRDDQHGFPRDDAEEAYIEVAVLESGMEARRFGYRLAIADCPLNWIVA